VNTLSLGCGLQDNLHSQSTKKNGADDASFFLSKDRDRACEIRSYLERHLDADTLPIPIKLSEGQATRDPNIFSQEMNIR
jgi:hypothetical protein